MRRVLLCFAFASMETTAGACGTTPGAALVHNAVPADLPSSFVVAEVDIRELKADGYDREGLHADVRRTVSGPAARRIILRTSLPSSCDAPLANGRVGLVVGKVLGTENGALVIDPVLAWRSNGFRLTKEEVKAIARW